MTQILLPRKSFSVAEYHQLATAGILRPEDRVELINGDIITMSPINSPHAATVDLIAEILYEQLHKKASIKGQNPIQLNDLSEPEPDITIAKYRKDGYYHQHPRPEDIYLLVEVADTTLEKDRTVKAPLYATAGIPEYWIVNIPDSQIEIFTNPKDGNYQNQQIIDKSGIAKASSIDFSLEAQAIFKF